MLKLNLRLIRNNPDKYLASVAADSARYILPTTGSQDADYIPPAFPIWFIAAHLLVLAAFLVQFVGVLGLHVARRLGAAIPGPFSDRNAVRTWWIALSLVLYNFVTTVTVGYTSPRHRIPTDALILLLVAGGMWMLLQALRGSRSGDRLLGSHPNRARVESP